MTKREYCKTHPAIAYYSGLNGIEIHGFEYGIDTYIYCTSGAWGGKKSYHKVKVHSTHRGHNFFIVHGYRIPTDECIRMGM